MTRRCRLVVEIDDADRAGLRPGSRIIVAKPHGNAAPNLVWLACQPAARTVVEWEESYGVYAAEIPARNDDAPVILDLVYPAQRGAVYPFTGSRFAAPVKEAAIPSGHYDVRNDGQDARSFGLAQQAFVDDRPIVAPVHRVALPPGFTADFAGRAQVCVWLSDTLYGGAAVRDVPAGAAFLTFGPVRRVRCRYDRASASFVPVGEFFSNDG